LFISRYIAFVRIIVPYLAGINRIRLRVFMPVVFVGSLAWTATFILAGSVIERGVMYVIHHWRVDLVPGILIFIALCVGYIYLHRLLKRKMEAAEERASADEEQHTTPDPSGKTDD
jgi:membrane protein DedA with SNARE-associated domain